MSKSTQEVILFIAGILAFIFIVYFVIKAIDALTQPSVVWWGIGVASCLAVQGLIKFGIIAKRNRRFWLDSVKRWFRETF